MKKTTLIYALSAVLMISFTSCRKNPYKGYSQHQDGYYYKFIEENKDAEKPVEGDLVNILLTLRIEGDTTNLFPPHGITLPAEGMQMPLDNVPSKADLLDVIQTMHLNDSASFIIDADTFFYYIAPELRPQDLQDGKKMTANIRLLKIMPKAEFEQMQETKMREYKEMMEMLATQEDSLMQDYLKKNNITVKPTASGLYFINQKTGTGAQPKAESTVVVHYTGHLLNGVVFDSSIERGKPFETKLNQVIPGWTEGIALMKVGGKARLIIPSKLAYGARDAGQIPPYSPLVFDVELIEVK